MSRVTCHMSRVICHMSHFIFIFFLFFFTKCCSLSVEGLLSTGPTPSSFPVPGHCFWVSRCILANSFDIGLLLLMDGKHVLVVVMPILNQVGDWLDLVNMCKVSVFPLNGLTQLVRSLKQKL